MKDKKIPKLECTGCMGRDRIIASLARAIDTMEQRIKSRFAKVIELPTQRPRAVRYVRENQD